MTQMRTPRSFVLVCITGMTEPLGGHDWPPGVRTTRDSFVFLDFQRAVYRLSLFSNISGFPISGIPMDFPDLDLQKRLSKKTCKFCLRILKRKDLLQSDQQYIKSLNRSPASHVDEGCGATAVYGNATERDRVRRP